MLEFVLKNIKIATAKLTSFPRCPPPLLIVASPLLPPRTQLRCDPTHLELNLVGRLIVEAEGFSVITVQAVNVQDCDVCI